MLKLFKKKEKTVDKATSKRAVVLALAFFVLISGSSWVLLSEFPWNGNLISWLRAREHYDRGYALAQRYYLGDAEKQFESAIKTFPGDWRFYQALASAQTKKHEWSQAEASLRKAIEMKPQNVDLKISLANCVSMQGEQRFAEAEQIIRQAVVADPVNAVALVQLALILEKQGKSEDAQKTYKGTERLEKESARFWYLSGQYHLLTKEMQRCETEFRQAAELDKTNPEYWETIGRMLYEKNDLEGAQHYFRRAALLNPNNAEYFAIVGEVSRRLEQFIPAEEAFSRAIEIEPKNVELLLNLGLTRFFQKDYERAETPLRKAVEFAPDDARPLRIYLKCLELQRKFDLAEKQLLKVLSKKENQNSASFAYCAAICIKAKDFDTAQKCLEQAQQMAAGKADLEAVDVLAKRLESSRLAVAQKRETPDELAMKKDIADKEAADLAAQKASAEAEQRRKDDEKANLSKTIIKLDNDWKETGPDLNQINSEDNSSRRRY